VCFALVGRRHGFRYLVHYICPTAHAASVAVAFLFVPPLANFFAHLGGGVQALLSGNDGDCAYNAIWVALMK
jgi:hypothetical protein